MRADAADTPALSDRGQEQSFLYDAFISYDHDDQPVARGIQRGLHRIGRRVGQLHALRVFRDSTDLTASPDLWGKVTEAMDRSRYMIAVLSPTRSPRHGPTRKSPTGCSGAGRISSCLSWPAGASPGTKPRQGLTRTAPPSPAW